MPREKNMGPINEKLREGLEKFNDKTAARMADLLARASEQVDEEEAKETIRNALNIISFLPSFLTFIVNLCTDSRVPFIKKFQIGVIIAYMFSPGEAILDALAGPIAYLDDAVLILYTVFLVAQLIGELGEDVIRDNWIGDPAQADELVRAAEGIGKFLGMRVSMDQAREVLQPASPEIID